MLTLVIETATAACSVALVDGARVVAEAHEIVGRGHAERLVPMIAALPASGRADRVLVDCGPGSFTGVRVGLAAALGLGIGWGVPVAGFSSLALIAAGILATRTEESVAVAIPGGHGEFFVQSFGRDFFTSSSLASLPMEKAAHIVDEHLVAGGGAAALVAARGQGEAIDALPRAADIVLLPAARTSLPPTPIYGRPPDAKPKP